MVTLAEIFRWIIYSVAAGYRAVAMWLLRRDKIIAGTERKFRALLESAPDAMIIVNWHGHITLVNGEVERMFGYDRDEIVGQNMTDLILDEFRNAHRQLQKSFAQEGIESTSRARREMIGLHKDGAHIPIEMSLSSMLTDRGPLLFVAIRDITERKQFEDKLQHLADHDELTGMFNRRRFEHELTLELARASRYSTGGAVLAIDIDHFKHVNDTLGHAVGDDLILRLGSLFRERLRSTDIIARLGGDEFAVILPRVSEDEAVLAAEGLLTVLHDECRLEMVTGPPRRVTASIGVAPFGPTPNTEEGVRAQANIAMYDAKEAGRDRVRLYGTDQDRQRSVLAGLTWEDRIRDALEEGGFVLHAQPIIALGKDPACARYELLIRMLDDEGRPIPPIAFLPVAERSDLILKIDRWVLAEAVRILAAEKRAGRQVYLAVNLSAKSVTDPELAGVLADELKASGIDGSGLCIEVTETAAIVNVDRAQAFAKFVGGLGCEFALDDFGSGFASFYYLKHMDFDYIKIDGEFIRDLSSSRINQLVVQSLVDIARGLGRRTIAEFVEDAETLALLAEYGIDFAQGYHVGRPQPLSETALGSAGSAVAAITA